MKASTIISYLDQDPSFLQFSEAVEKSAKVCRLKGLAGSADVAICGQLHQQSNRNGLVILHDAEEASYFQYDLENIFPDLKVLLFPTSYKRPYSFDEIENANILQRSEVLDELSSNASGNLIIVTYPEALSEKVINKRSLVSNTFVASIGEQLDTEFLQELLTTYDFERTDFVYEPGQFAIRGGIMDIFSFSRDQPYRLELFGDEIESIREFDVETQLSTLDLDKISIVPNTQTRLLKEERQSFLEFIGDEFLVWIKDYRETADIVDRCFDKASENFQSLLALSDQSQVVLSPDAIFDNSKTFLPLLNKVQRIEFGKKYYLQTEAHFEFQMKPQPDFKRNFELLINELQKLHQQNYQVHIFSDSQKQLERLESIFSEVDTSISWQPVHAGIRAGFMDDFNKMVFYTDHQIFERFHRVKKKEKFSKKKALTLKELKSLQTGDYVVHIDHGVARFAGLDKVDVNGNMQEALRLVYRDNDLLYVSIHSLHKISRYSGKEGEPPTTNKLGSADWDNKKKKVKRQVKDIARDLIKLYAKRKSAIGFAFPPDNFLQVELESSFIYEDTPDQTSATSDVKSDMELENPMDRLVCGDVGFGKTEVAIRAAFKAVNAGKQVAVLVPTTILAMQHYNTFGNRLKNFPIVVDYVNRFRTTKEITQTRKDLSAGKIDILIGTHRIVNKDIEFKDLGLMIIDEEQKFGVKVKERLKEMRINVDALTLTATPIPRTLHFSLMGARDLSIISTAPPNRRPVTTEIHEFNEEVIRDAIRHELRRGGQVFFVHNRINDIENIANTIYHLVPDAKIGIAHGQMEGKQLEKVMMRFINGEYDVLVSTNIIESGLDITNANTIIINRANMFGLSDLHQMRGRVGRSNTQAYCYLLTPPSSILTADARKRLITLEEFSDLGDGFKVAMRDLDIRGAGNLLGSEQSGFINDMGFDMYHKILDEAVHELKEEEFKDLFESELLDAETLQNLANDCLIETDLELLIPQDYVGNTTERLQLYTELDNLENDEDLIKFEKSLADRFGPVPSEVKEMIKSVKLRWKGMQLGFDKVTLKKEVLRCTLMGEKADSYFQSDTFGKILKYVQMNPRQTAMKEMKNKLVIAIKGITEVGEGVNVLNSMLGTEEKQHIAQ
ncbi:MAG: transcription-repair coupling factor [Cyclobacteriaceae bacterium]